MAGARMGPTPPPARTSQKPRPDLCRRLPVVAECLAAAIASDDRAEWRGGIDRADRERLWAGLERTYREVRDFELMRLDVNRLAGRAAGVRPARQPERRSAVSAGEHSENASIARPSVCQPSGATTRQRGEPCDFAGFIAGSSTLPQPTSVDPTSFSLPTGLLGIQVLRSVLEGTMGGQPRDWLKFRTEPVVGHSTWRS